MNTSVNVATFKTNNFNELFDGDSIIIDELGGSYIFKKYENSIYRDSTLALSSMG